MEQKNKDLLIRDLCARLPYGVKAVLKRTNCHNSSKHKVNEKDIYSFRTGKPLEEDYGQHDYYKVVVTDIKPYLFPLSSMTDEQYKVYHELIGGMFGTSVLINFEVLTDFFHANHFDYRGLIKKGLAIDATGLNIY